MIFHSLTLGVAINFMRTTFSGMLLTKYKEKPKSFQNIYKYPFLSDLPVSLLLSLYDMFLFF